MSDPRPAPGSTPARPRVTPGGEPARATAGARPWSWRRLHFVGVGGAGMSGYARAARALGARVSGSDRHASPYTERLAADGVLRASIGPHDAANVPAGEDVEVIYSSAVPAENPERAAARERGLTERPRAELLAELTALRPTIAVAGTHGKTTTSAMLVRALDAAGLRPGWLVGGTVGEGQENAHWGEDGGSWLVVEADESDRSMLALDVDVAILTNVELDHHATYGSLAELRDAFRGFLALARRAIVVWDRPELLELLPGGGPGVGGGLGVRVLQKGPVRARARTRARHPTFEEQPPQPEAARPDVVRPEMARPEVVPTDAARPEIVRSEGVRPETIRREVVAYDAPDPELMSGDPWPEVVAYDAPSPELTPGGSRFDWRGHEVTLAVPGAHNALNATAALEAARLAGADEEHAAAGLAGFEGAGRRFQLLGTTAGGARVYDDYAHHPTEVAATLAGARTLAGMATVAGTAELAGVSNEDGRLVAVFQPHLFSRTAMFTRELGAALAEHADVTVVLDVYPARERAEDYPGVSGLLVAQAAADAAHGKPVYWLPTFADAEPVLRGLLRAGDLCVVMGAGDVDTLARRLVTDERREDTGSGEDGR